MIAGVLPPDAGSSRRASLEMGYFAHQASTAEPRVHHRGPQHDFPHESIGALRNLAGAFQFSARTDKKVRALSGGETTSWCWRACC